MRVSMLALALILFSPAVFSWAQTVNGPEGEKMTPQRPSSFQSNDQPPVQAQGERVGHPPKAVEAPRPARPEPARRTAAPQQLKHEAKPQGAKKPEGKAPGQSEGKGKGKGKRL